MAQIYINFHSLEQRNVRIEEQIEHIRRFLRLAERCREMDAMHQDEWSDIHSRLEKMENNLKQIIDVTQNMMGQYLKINYEIADQMKMIKQNASHIFE